MAKRGLPERSVMRADSHYVEELTRRSGRHIGSMLPLQFIEPNAGQPRTQLGNIEEPAASVREAVLRYSSSPAARAPWRESGAER